ncbi:hypothetical protein ACFQLX_14905 [Streptomyces polyrhachis]|uniref:Knr4/Smi1-like domain-containing protein n=1 Tax=Streptomyces polyrhachis TaxID=1282885 RepID=A0ABW2GJ39_9ACTN
MVKRQYEEPQSLQQLLAEIAARQGCAIDPPSDQKPVLPVPHRLPGDLDDLFRRCGGVHLHIDAEYPWHIAGPSRLEPAGPLLLTQEIAEQVAAESPEDLTNDCYVIAQDSPGTSSGQYVVVDLHPTRLGRCYLTAWDTFGLVGDMPVVATSVTSLLRWLLRLGGGDPNDQTPALGDAYDVLGNGLR